MPTDTLPVLWKPPFLSSLIKAYAVIDGGVRLALRQESALRAAQPACRRGCAHCCARGEAQVSPLELAGALWHASRDLDGESFRVVSARLAGQAGQGGCPFLLGEACAVHAMRFASCRQQFVFGRACLPGEDPAMTRRADLFTPMRRFALRGVAIMIRALGHDPVPATPEALSELWRELCAPVKTWSTPDPQGFVRAVAEGLVPSGSRLAA